MEKSIIEDFVRGFRIALPSSADIPLASRLQHKIKNVLKSYSKAPGEFQAPYPSVALSFWRPESADFVNFGDELAAVIVELILARRGYTRHDQVKRNRRLLTIGSSLHRAVNDTVVWGTGLHGASLDRDHAYQKLDVRAVRGPLTRKFLLDRGIPAPAVYGDPALLLPLLAPGRFSNEKHASVGFVPNLHEFNEAAAALNNKQVKIIDPRRQWNAVVQDILSCERIVASSLHGLVIADAYGIPNCFFRFTKRENILKYHDYYLGTGRFMHEAETLDDAIAYTTNSQPAIDKHWQSAALMDSFPWDIWDFPTH